MGTLGAGNHYAEVQVVDEIFDEAAARKMGIDTIGQVRTVVHVVVGVNRLLDVVCGAMVPGHMKYVLSHVPLWLQDGAAAAACWNVLVLDLH